MNILVWDVSLMETMAWWAIRLLWRRGEQGIVVIERSVHLNNLGAAGAMHLIHLGNGGCCWCVQYYQVSHQMLNLPFCGKYLVLPNGLRLSSGGLYTVTSAELSHRRGARTKFRVTWIYPSPRNLRARRDLRRQPELSTELIRRHMQKD